MCRPLRRSACKAIGCAMRRTRPDPSIRGFTLIEMVVAIVLVAIVVGATVFFANPVRQAADLTTRAALTDVADNALQRIGREVRLALPNSVRSSTAYFVEFVPVRSAGRYRAEPSSPSVACLTGTD